MVRRADMWQKATQDTAAVTIGAARLAVYSELVTDLWGFSIGKSDINSSWRGPCGWATPMSSLYKGGQTSVPLQ